MTPHFFSTAAKFRKWLETNHATAPDIILCFHVKSAGKAGLAYSEALDEALCFGWIDGVRRRLDATTYAVRFSSRKARSIWSKVNLAHVERLQQAGRMTPAGSLAHAARDPARTGIYSFENRPQKLSAEDEKTFRRETPAWDFFLRQSPSYQRTVIWWIISAKKEETHRRRLAQLIGDSTAGRKLAQFDSAKKPTG